MSDLKFLLLTPERWDDFEKLFGPHGAIGGCWRMGWWLNRFATRPMICYSIDLGGEWMMGNEFSKAFPLLSGDRIMRAGDADPRLSLRRRRREIALRILY